MKRFVRLLCFALCIILLFSCVSCAKNTPEPEQEPMEEPEPVSGADPGSIDNLSWEDQLPYTFDTETPSEILDSHNQIHQITETEEEILESYRKNTYGYRRHEYAAPDDRVNGLPETAPVYIRTYRQDSRADLTDAELSVAKENFTRYASCYTACFADGVIDYEGPYERYYGGSLNYQKVCAYPDGISIGDVSITCPRNGNWTHPSVDDVLYEIEHNPYVKAACEMQGVSHPSVLTGADIGHDPHDCDWSVVIYEEQNDAIKNAYQSAFRCVELRSNYRSDNIEKQTMSLRIALTRVEVVEEAVPLLPAQTALDRVLEGYYYQTGALFGVGGCGKRNMDSVFAVRLTYRYYLSGDHLSWDSPPAAYVPFYEVFQVDICDTPEEPYQDRTLYPACNRYWKNETEAQTD